MRHLLLRPTRNASLSADEAEHIVRGFAEARILGRDGKTMLVDFDPCELDALRQRLPGWLVSEQGPPVPVPDSCLHIKP
ncbi:hypothetical protein MJ904_05050 [Massilia sp. MB5]|uniref:hypothetical protein n=1 Tax=unclassified Massilia TaxID=2609279 RepID=UPI00067AD1B5|nr:MULTISPECIES: hypothetical protein [unclassified Massilia]AKU23483.1 hypothetical protein ACZ75_20510 [Massilia sp. NR 4-1]UMR31587.1 hypothetical protein MJ904_05050 [Massilia sp. MB5]